MRRSTVLVFSLFLSCSLNLNAQVKNGGLYDTYKSMLTVEDLFRLRQGKEVFFKFIDERPGLAINGDVRVIPTKILGEYNFVEIGDWKKEYDFDFSNSNRGHHKGIIVYDSLGHVISSKMYERLSGQNQYFLKEEWTLKDEIIDGIPYHYYSIQSYYNTGELWIDTFQRILDYEIPLRNCFKSELAG
ncbi:hypothetical protein [Adhaeribacter terreus]|uniref:WG repeat-containing protein n=1 Tax=Adhaeribacter terreus TaxID=529703 RepID=A0ABW0EDU4_9BACT